MTIFAKFDSQTSREVENTDELSRVVGENLRRFRTRKGLSLERLAHASGVSRAMLGQIELGRSMPTIGVLWKIAKSLDAPLASFTAASGEKLMTVLRAERSQVLSSVGGKVFTRALFPLDDERRTEFYELRILPEGVEALQAQSSGTLGNLVLTEGSVELLAGNRCVRLAPGDALQFQADADYRLTNLGDGDAVLFLVFSFSEKAAVRSL